MCIGQRFIRADLVYKTRFLVTLTIKVIGQENMNAKLLQQRLREQADAKAASDSLRFFKTGKGDYGESDAFLGVRMPALRKMAGQFSTLPLTEVGEVIRSTFHEERMLALLILVKQFNKSKHGKRQEICDFYLANTKHINNWDLVDCSAYFILGPALEQQLVDKSIFLELAHSGSIWERRIAMVASLHFIRRTEFQLTLELAEFLLTDQEDLIQKATGWMLKEIGKRDKKVLIGFLAQHYKIMPRTMLRYAIEKFSREEKTAYLKGLV